MGGGGNLPIGPGFWGFVAFFVLAIALWLLVRNMSGRLRRMAYREREREAMQADRDTVIPDASSGSTDPADLTDPTRPRDADEPNPGSDGGASPR